MNGKRTLGKWVFNRVDFIEIKVVKEYNDCSEWLDAMITCQAYDMAANNCNGDNGLNLTEVMDHYNPKLMWTCVYDNDGNFDYYMVEEYGVVQVHRSTLLNELNERFTKG